MTIGQALEIIDKKYPNHFDDAVKIGWLSELDGKVHAEILLTHDGDVTAFGGYRYDDDRDTTLLVPEPFAYGVYTRYLEMMIDQEYKEIERYNQSATLYNAAYLEFENWYNRTHMPRSRGAFQF